MKRNANLAIVAGCGATFGSGHETRMSLFCDYAKSKQQTAALYQSESPLQLLPLLSSAEKSPDLIILDARDVDPQPFARIAPCIALDNRHACRDASSRPEPQEFALIFHDTLPHPAVDLGLALKNALLADDLLQCRYRGASSQLLIVGGQLRWPIYGWNWLQHLRAANPELEFCYLGASPPAPLPGDLPLRVLPRMPRREFLDLLCNARAALVYPGMAMLEAWRLQLPFALYDGGSAVHATLVEDLRQRAKLPALKASLADNPAVLDLAAMDACCRRVFERFRPGDRGLSRLLQTAQDLL
ncbi:MAG: hypothetical protein K1X75_02460 [Leptospirales bacterium]|nr:hypothetical protein [Leptospirales bacterium]